MEKYLKNLSNNTQIKIALCETDINNLSGMGVKISVIADATNCSRFSNWVDISMEVADLIYVEMNKIMKVLSFSSKRSLYEQMLEVSAEIVLSEIDEGNIQDIDKLWEWNIQ